VGEFGNKFRQAREKKELSLDDVSNVTKISSRMLQAIEEEHFDQLPGGVFNKGFIRAYAKHLGLNSEDAVSDYLACLRQAQIDSHIGWDTEPRNGRSAPEAKKGPEGPIASVALKPHPTEEVEELPELQLPRAEHIRSAKKEYLGSQPSARPRALIGFAVLVLVTGIFLWMRYSRASRPTSAQSSVPPVIASAAPPTASAPASTAVTNPVALSAKSKPATPSAPVAVTPTSSAPPATNAPADSDNLAAAQTPKPAAEAATTADPSQVKVERKGDVTIRSFGGSSSTPTEDTAAKLTLVVRASENSWISVTSDGQLLTQETLIAPAATSFHATRELVVRVGNAAGVSFLWNGEELSPQGAEAEAKTFVFDAQGMRTTSPIQPAAQN